MNKKFLSVALCGALLAFSSGTFTSCKDYDDDINSLNERVDANSATLNEKAAALQTALDAANREIEAAKTAAANAKTAADKAAADATSAIATAKAAAITEAVNQIKALDYASASDVEEVLSKVTALEAVLGNVKFDDLATKEQVAALQSALDLQAEALATFVKNEDYAADKAKFTTWKAEIDALKETVATKDDLKKLTEEIGKYNQSLVAVNALFSRLTSMVYLPNFYIDGIETMPFYSYIYNPITIKKDYSLIYADDIVTLEDGSNFAEYYINPSYIAAENIKSLKVLMNNAIAINTRSANDVLSATIASIQNGKMRVNFKKNTAAPLTKGLNLQGRVDTLTMVALQAEVAENAFVTSDWTRIVEAYEGLHLYNVKDTAVRYNHFRTYDEVTVDTFVLAQVPYTQTIDLKKYVGVHTEGFAPSKDVDLEACGLAIEYNLVTYLRQDEEEEETDQAKFATLVDGVVSSRAYNGATNNKDAIGRTPIIQIILRDVNNNNIIDVRYVKIEWTEVPVVPVDPIIVDLGALDITFNKAVFACDYEYVGLVGTETMNEIYAEIVENGISKDEFHATFELDAELYASFENAKKGKAADELGTIEEIVAGSSDVTYNLQWNVGALTLTKELYEAGVISKKAYGRYMKGQDLYIFELSFSVTVKPVTFAGGYVQTFWNAGQELVATNAEKSFQVNPALTDDTTWGKNKFDYCSIAADMLKAYTATELNKLASAGTVRMVFDATRVKTMLGTDWSVKENMLMYKKDTAALINEDHIIALWDRDGSAKASEAAQKLLGKSVPVALVAQPYECAEFEVIIDQFEVNFINPLKLILNEVNDSFKDLLTGGDTVSIANIATVQETFGLKRAIVENGELKNEELKDWYVVEDIVWDLENIKTNLKKDGQNIVIGSEIKQNFSQFADLYNISVTDDGKGLVFKNTSSAHIQQAFQIAIPVFVKTKWSPTLADPETTVVVLTINPGDYEQ